MQVPTNVLNAETKTLGLPASSPLTGPCANNSVGESSPAQVCFLSHRSTHLIAHSSAADHNYVEAASVGFPLKDGLNTVRSA